MEWQRVWETWILFHLCSHRRIQRNFLADWEHLLQEIILHSSYETIVLDIGNGIEEVFQMLDMCTTVYTPIKTDKMSRSKLAQFEELLSVRDYPQI